MKLQVRKMSGRELRIKACLMSGVIGIGFRESHETTLKLNKANPGQLFSSQSSTTLTLLLLVNGCEVGANMELDLKLKPVRELMFLVGLESDMQFGGHLLLAAEKKFPHWTH